VVGSTAGPRQSGPKVARLLSRQVPIIRPLAMDLDREASYRAVRALREPDAFPAKDLGLLRTMRRHLARPSPAVLLQRAERWRPWRAYAAVLLWLDAT